MNTNEFFGIQNFLTLGGAIVVVTVITNGLKYAFRLKPRYIALVVSFVVILLGTIIKKDLSLEAILLVIPNTFLLYISSVGLATVTSGGQRTKDTSIRHPKPIQNPIEEISSEVPSEFIDAANQEKISFWAPWF
jgi:hypothetical protein